MPKVSVSFDAHDVNFPIHKLIKQVNRVEGVDCRFSAFNSEIILSSKEYDSYDLESIYNKYVSELEEEKPEKKEVPLISVNKISVTFSIDDMGTESSSYIVRTCAEISESEDFSAKPLIGDKLLIETDGSIDSMDIVRLVGEYFRLD